MNRLNNNKTIYFFVSKQDFNNKIIYPKIPIHKSDNENDKIKRICVSQSIYGCLSALPVLMTDDIINIYKCYSNDVIKPSKKDVIDVNLTGEVWLIEPVKMFFYKKIQITGVIKSIYSIAYSFNYI